MKSLAVLITYFNEGPLLTECLDSLLSQAQTPEEVLVYDDSADFSASRYVPAGSLVQIVRGSGDKGPSRGRNTLLGQSRGDYVHFHDADDLFLPRWSECVRRAMAESGADVILTEVSARRDKQVLRERFVELDRPENGDFVSLAFRGSVMPCGSIFRREAILAVGGYREDLTKSEDYDFHVRMAVSGARMHRVCEPLVIFRVRAEGLTHRDRTEHVGWTHRTEILRSLSRELDARYSPLLGDEAMRNGSRLFRLGARRQAREAFQLARQLGGTTDISGPRWYRRLAGMAGPQFAEWALYVRHGLAEGLRRLGLIPDGSQGRTGQPHGG
jgi:glycosyltransferase involved in cell wall biosynthesis